MSEPKFCFNSTNSFHLKLFPNNCQCDEHITKITFDNMKYVTQLKIYYKLGLPQSGGEVERS